MMFSRVVLPAPERPRTASSSPAYATSDTSRKACTAVRPLPYWREPRCTRTTSAAPRAPSRSATAVPRPPSCSATADLPVLVPRPDLDVVRLQVQPYPVPQLQRLHVRPRQLHPTRPVQQRVLLRHLHLAP